MFTFEYFKTIQVKVSNARRYYTCGFNLTVGAAESLRFVRENGREYPIQFIEAAFNEETSGFELFIEFEEPIKATVFMSHLNAVAAGMDPISLSSSHEEAAVAVLRVRQMAAKTKLGYIRGAPTWGLESAIVLCLANNTGAAGGASGGAGASSMDIENLGKQLGRVEDVVGQTRDIAAEARASAAEAASKSNEVSIKVVDTHEKVSAIDGKIDGMKLCEEMNASLKQQLTHKTKEVDRIEHAKGEVTKKLNRSEAKRRELEDRAIRAELSFAKSQEELEEARRTIAVLRAAEWAQELVQAHKRARTDAVDDAEDN